MCWCCYITSAKIQKTIHDEANLHTINCSIGLAAQHAWRIQVYGYAGAFNASLCYTLRASISATAFREGQETPVADLNTTPSESEVVIANVFPNPTNGKLNVILEASEAQNTQLRICDITGRTALQQNVVCVSGSNTIILDMESLPNGYYLLVIDNGNASSTMRVVKN